jgi:hypothetical protein
MQNITLKTINKYFKDNNLEVRHNLKAVKKAINTLNKEVKTDSFNLFLLIVENKPIDNLHTHSYGFHTSNARYLIDSFKSLYYEFNI